MFRTLTLTLGALVVFSSVLSAPAQGQAVCGTRADIAKGLKTSHSEMPVSRGLANNGTVIEVFASVNGSFTVLLSQANGISCIVSAGENWQTLAVKNAKTGA